MCERQNKTRGQERAKSRVLLLLSQAEPHLLGKALCVCVCVLRGGADEGEFKPCRCVTD